MLEAHICRDIEMKAVEVPLSEQVLVLETRQMPNGPKVQDGSLPFCLLLRRKKKKKRVIFILRVSESRGF